MAPTIPQILRQATKKGTHLFYQSFVLGHRLLRASTRSDGRLQSQSLDNRFHPGLRAMSRSTLRRVGKGKRKSEKTLTSVPG
jgi:hypothetical protein